MQAKLTLIRWRWQNCTSVGIAHMWLSLLLVSYCAGQGLGCSTESIFGWNWWEQWSYSHTMGVWQSIRQFGSSGLLSWPLSHLCPFLLEINPLFQWKSLNIQLCLGIHFWGVISSIGGMPVWFENSWGFGPECPYPGNAVSSHAGPGQRQSLLEVSWLKPGCLYSEC